MTRRKRPAENRGFASSLREIALGGVGAAALAFEGAERLARKFLARGEKEEPRIRRALAWLDERRRRASERIDAGLKRLAGRIPVVRGREMKELGERIETLAGKIDALSKRRRGTAR